MLASSHIKKGEKETNKEEKPFKWWKIKEKIIYKKKYNYMEDIENYKIVRKYLLKEKKETNIIKMHMDTKIPIIDLVKTLKLMSKNGELENYDNFDNLIIKEK